MHARETHIENRIGMICYVFEYVFGVSGVDLAVTVCVDIVCEAFNLLAFEVLQYCCRVADVCFAVVVYVAGDEDRGIGRLISEDVGAEMIKGRCDSAVDEVNGRVKGGDDALVVHIVEGNVIAVTLGDREGDGDAVTRLIKHTVLLRGDLEDNVLARDGGHRVVSLFLFNDSDAYVGSGKECVAVVDLDARFYAVGYGIGGGIVKAFGHIGGGEFMHRENSDCGVGSLSAEHKTAVLEADCGFKVVEIVEIDALVLKLEGPSLRFKIIVESYALGKEIFKRDVFVIAKIDLIVIALVDKSCIFAF